MIHHMDEGIGRLLACAAAPRPAGRHAGGLHQRQRRRALLRQLAAGRRQDGPDRRRHPRALHRALAGGGAARRRQRAALPDDGLDGDDARCGRRGARTRTTRWTACRCCRCCATRTRRFERPMYWRMNHRGQRALRDGDWKYLRVDGHEYLFDIGDDERERANRAAARARAAAAPARRLGRLERDDAADSRRRHGQPGLFGQGHAAALKLRRGGGWYRLAVARLDELADSNASVKSRSRVPAFRRPSFESRGPVSRCSRKPATNPELPYGDCRPGCRHRTWSSRSSPHSLSSPPLASIAAFHHAIAVIRHDPVLATGSAVTKAGAFN